MNELLIAGISFALGVATAMIMFRWGAAWATRIIYEIKTDKPLTKIGLPMEQEFSGETD